MSSIPSYYCSLEAMNTFESEFISNGGLLYSLFCHFTLDVNIIHRKR